MMELIKKNLKILLNRLFSVREGEYRTAALMQLNIFLLLSTLLIVKPSVNALFLSRFGAEHLPAAFILVAMTALVVSMFYARWLGKKLFNQVIERTLILSFSTLLFFSVLMKFNVLEGWVLYLFYVWTAIFALLSTSQFWILANLVYNVREAKRLFGFIGIGAIAGGIFGGYLTNLLAPYVGSENLLFVSASFLLLCIPVTRLIWKENVSILSPFKRGKRIRGFGENPMRTILSSKHLTYLAGIIGVSVIVAKLVEFQFSDVAHQIITDSDELAAFFGFWYSTINLLSLIIQLFLTTRIVGFWGVGKSLIFLPAGIMAGAVLLTIFPELWAAIFLKAADGSLKQSINKSAIELLGLPIAAEIKNRTKTFIDVVIDSVATGVAGFILIFIVAGMGLTTRPVSVTIILFIAGWLYLIVKARKEYIKTFKLKVADAASETRNSALHTDPQSVIGGIEKILESGTEEQIIYILDKIRELNQEQLYEKVPPLLQHTSGNVRSEAIQTLYFYHSKPMVERIKPFIYDPEFYVKLAAFEYLFDHESADAEEQLAGYLDHSEQSLAEAALLSLAIETRNNATLKSKYNLLSRIQSKIEAVEHCIDSKSCKHLKMLVMELLGHANIESLNHHILHGLNDENQEVVEKAIQSAGNALDPILIKPLIKLLGKEEFRTSTQKSLANYREPVINYLMQVVDQKSVSVECLRSIPGVLEQLDSQKAVDALFQLLNEPDYRLKLQVTQSLNRAKVKFPHLNYHRKKVAQHIFEEGKLYLNTLSALHAQIIKTYKKADSDSKQRHEQLQQARKELIEVLEGKLDSDLKRIFDLLGLKYPPEDIDNAYEGIRSSKPDQRVNAIEFLDNLLEPDLKRVLIPIVETVILDFMSEETLRTLSLRIPDEKECIEMLLAGNHRRIKMAVLDLIKHLEDPQYIPVVKPLVDSSDDKISAVAKKLISKIEKPRKTGD